MTIWVEVFGEVFLSICSRSSVFIYSIKVVKTWSVFPIVLWWGQINHNKIVWLRPRVFAKFLNCSFVMSWDTWSLNMWPISFGLEETDKRNLHFLELFDEVIWNNFDSNTNNHNLNAFHERNMLYTCSASEARDRQISWDSFALETVVSGQAHRLLIRKNCTQ